MHTPYHTCGKRDEHDTHVRNLKKLIAVIRQRQQDFKDFRKRHQGLGGKK